MMKAIGCLTLLSAVFVAGCGTPPVADPKLAFSAPAPADAPPFKFGVYGWGYKWVKPAVAKAFIEAGQFPNAKILDNKGCDESCDLVAIVYCSDNLGSGPATVEVSSARTKEKLYQAKNPGMTCESAVPPLGEMVRAAFARGTELYAKVSAALPAAAAPAAAPPAPREAGLPPSPAPSFSAPERSGDLAVVVGIESYSDIASKAPYAERDADAFKAHVRALGVPERNIILLKGTKAGKASLEKNIEVWLPRMAKADSRVYFYFSGHGAPDVKTGQAYLVPWDGDPNFLESTAYPVAKLYKKLGELPAKQVLVAMDSCFSGAGGRSVLASGARPLVSKIETGSAPANLTVLAASAANEISGSLDDKGHGAFTYFLLKGLDAGKTTPKALTEYLTPLVQDEARRLNRDQTPQLQGDGDWSLR